jgi:hypothetical protein
MKNKIALYFFVATLALMQECSAATASPAGGDFSPKIEAFRALSRTAQKITACTGIVPEDWSMEDLLEIAFYFQTYSEKPHIESYIRINSDQLGTLKANILRFIDECENRLSQCHDSLEHEHDFCSSVCILFQQALAWLNTLG